MYYFNFFQNVTNLTPALRHLVTNAKIYQKSIQGKEKKLYDLFMDLFYFYFKVNIMKVFFFLRKSSNFQGKISHKVDLKS